MNRKILIGLLLVAILNLSFVHEAEARHRRHGGYYGGGGSAVAAIVGAGLLSSAFNRGYGYGGCGSYGGGYGGYGYSPYGYGGGYGGSPYGYGGGYGYSPYGYDPYYSAPVAYAPVYGGYGYSPYYRPYRRHSNVVPALIGGALLYSALRHR